MDILHLLDGLHARQYFHGGDGIDVSESANRFPLASVAEII